MDRDEAFSHALESIVLAGIDWNPARGSAAGYAKYRAWVPLYCRYRRGRRGSYIPMIKDIIDYGWQEFGIEHDFAAAERLELIDKLESNLSSHDMKYLRLRAEGSTRNELKGRFFAGKSSLQYQEKLLLARARIILRDNVCH